MPVMISSFRRAHAQCVIVNGASVRHLKTRPRRTPATICSLRASAGEIERRFIAGTGADDTGGLPQEVRNEIRLMDESGFAGACRHHGRPAYDAPARSAPRARTGLASPAGLRANGQFSVQPGPAIGGRVALITARRGESPRWFRFT
jgi:hypothetical protein